MDRYANKILDVFASTESSSAERKLTAEDLLDFVVAFEFASCKRPGVKYQRFAATFFEPIQPLFPLIEEEMEAGLFFTNKSDSGSSVSSLSVLFQQQLQYLVIVELLKSTFKSQVADGVLLSALKSFALRLLNSDDSKIQLGESELKSIELELSRWEINKNEMVSGDTQKLEQFLDLIQELNAATIEFDKQAVLLAKRCTKEQRDLRQISRSTSLILSGGNDYNEMLEEHIQLFRYRFIVSWLAQKHGMTMHRYQVLHQRYADLSPAVGALDTEWSNYFMSYKYRNKIMSGFTDDSS